jgi:hypothetical protein
VALRETTQQQLFLLSLFSCFIILLAVNREQAHRARQLTKLTENDFIWRNNGLQSRSHILHTAATAAAAAATATTGLLNL